MHMVLCAAIVPVSIPFVALRPLTVDSIRSTYPELIFHIFRGQVRGRHGWTAGRR